ncbi:MAG: ABC transporter permease subunit [Acholeplasmatales bacterium]|jgi:D-methionine transport system permease protein|nr:ABC transporter permease subunit [Acholeplasmatales bacterium]
MNILIDIKKLSSSFLETLELVFIPLIFVIVIGLLLGFILFITGDTGLLKKSKLVKVIHLTIYIITDVARSIPFVILIYAVIPFTLSIVKTILGVRGAIPPLVISASPFFARIVYNALKETNKGAIEALQALGASIPKIIKVLFIEILPGLIRGLTITVITLVGFVAAAGAVGAGGLGFYAKQRASVLDYNSTTVAVILILILVFIIQFAGDFIAKKIDRK